MITLRSCNLLPSCKRKSLVPKNHDNNNCITKKEKCPSWKRIDRRYSITSQGYKNSTVCCAVSRSLWTPGFRAGLVIGIPPREWTKGDPHYGQERNCGQNAFEKPRTQLSTFVDGPKRSQSRFLDPAQHGIKMSFASSDHTWTTLNPGVNRMWNSLSLSTFDHFQRNAPDCFLWLNAFKHSKETTHSSSTNKMWKHYEKRDRIYSLLAELLKVWFINEKRIKHSVFCTISARLCMTHIVQIHTNSRKIGRDNYKIEMKL